MDFRTVVSYMKHGYRVRRSSWEPESYMKLDCLGGFEQYHMRESYTIKNGAIHKNRYLSNCCSDIDINDVLAEDWELITTGIRKEFSKHENGMEYDDDTDWDNYVPPKGGWGFDDEDE